MLGITQSATLVGVDAYPVQVEVNTGEAGELKFILEGLPDAAVKESQDRVFSAMANSGFRTPATRTTIAAAHVCRTRRSVSIARLTKSKVTYSNKQWSNSPSPPVLTIVSLKSPGPLPISLAPSKSRPHTS